MMSKFQRISTMSRRTFATALVLSGLSSACLGNPIKSNRSTTAFAQSVGINMHSGVYPQNKSYNYTNPTLVEAALKYLQIYHIRDALGAGFSKSGYDYTTAVEKQLAKDGFKFDFSLNNVQAYEIQALENFSRSYPGALETIEGPNECNSLSVAQALSFQQTLYQTIHNDPLTKFTPVMDFTLTYGSTTYFQKYGDLSSMADQGNVHVYSINGRSPISNNWSAWLAAAQVATPNKLMNVTETGYTTYASDSYLGVDEYTQAAYLLDTLMDAASSNIGKTYIYELFDKYTSNASNPNQGSFGLFRGDGATPKLSAIAIHNLMTILYTGASAPKTLDSLDVYTSTWYQGTQKPAGLNSLLLKKSDNMYDLVLWSEPNVWDSNKHVYVAPVAQAVTLTMRSATATTVFDPMIDFKAVQAPQNPQNFTVNVTDHPVIIEVKVKSQDTSVVADLNYTR